MKTISLILPEHRFTRHILISWFVLAVIALAFSGIYSFLPYTLRTPFLAKLLNMQSLFSVSLMVHVNLGILVWFLSSAAMLMSLIIKEIFAPISFTAFIASMMGTVFLIVSPFIGESEPIKNDYVPILHNFVFILGLSLFLSGILLQSILTLLSYVNIKNNLLNLVSYVNALIFVVAVICFAKSAIELKIITQTRFIDLLEYYQLLFWGAGHVLQFCYVQLIIFVWLVIVSKLSPDLVLKTKSFFTLQWFNFGLIIIAIGIYWLYPLDSPELNMFFTLHMKYVGGILAIITAIWSCFKLRHYAIYRVISDENEVFDRGSCEDKLLRSPACAADGSLPGMTHNVVRFEFSALCASIFLLLAGGVIGYCISGANVTVPAHYHGVILGITVGLMGLFYILLPELGFQKVSDRAANWQIWLYTIGQFIHVVALAISGGYGVLRKTPGSELTMKAKIFMGAMGIGGSIALVGGILFIVIIYKNMKTKKVVL